MSSIEETYCLILGGGPVGLSLAIDLGLRQVPAILVNQNLATAEFPKCNSSNEDTPEAEASRQRFGAFIAEDDKDEYATVGVQLGERYESQIVMESSETPPADLWDRYESTDFPGCRAPHFVLPDGESLYDALVPDFGLIAFAGADCTAIEIAAAAHGLPLTYAR